MTLTKSKPNNINRHSGNNLSVFIDDITGALMLMDINGNTQPLSDYSPIPHYRAAFYSTETQNSLGSEVKKVSYNKTDIGGQGIILQNNSEILIENAGDYDIQHSIQVVKTQGGSAGDFYLWLIKNGTPMADTNTKLTLTSNNAFQVAAWNFFVRAAQNDIFELGWYATSSHIELHYDSSPEVGLPAIPSIICTINRIG